MDSHDTAGLGRYRRRPQHLPGGDFMTVDPFRLDGEVAVVTGGTAGIGFETARVLLNAGARVVVCGRNRERGRHAVELLRAVGDVHFTPADVSDENSVSGLFAVVRSRYGPVSVLVNNAGPTDLLHSRDVDGPLGAVQPTAFATLMERTVTSSYLPTREALTDMLGARAGSIVMISSMAAAQAMPGFDTYATGKGAIESMTRAIAGSYGHLNIRCNAIRVGRIAVDHGGGLRAAADPAEEDPEAWRGPAPPKAGAPEDIAHAVLYLSSAAGRYVNGVVLPVDGGVGSRSLMPWQTPRPEMLDEHATALRGD
ncbi:SDR family NAD(P)-dependent oxidoreductase [Rhodococcus koreensis]|uniref:SDR family NAD(P)-dependent oxidoreductase n=1 Tax=Rhodococcus koreensis TaxID=99653 RepID=UPI0036D855C4